jgi:hypothetical protein
VEWSGFPRPASLSLDAKFSVRAVKGAVLDCHQRHKGFITIETGYLQKIE